MRIHNEDKLKDFYKKEKLNVALVTDAFYPSVGGVENVVSNLCNSFYKNKNVNVVCITGDVKGCKDFENFAIIRTKSIKVPKKWGLCQPVPELDNKFKKQLDKLKIDVFHLHTVYGVASYCLKYAKKNNIPVLFHAHSKFNEEIPTCVKNKLIANIVVKRAYKFVNKCDKVIAVSNATRLNYIKNGVIDPQIIVIPNTTNMKTNTNETEIKKYFCDKYNITKNSPVLLFVGRMEMKCKNLDFLLESLKILKEKNFDFKMFMIGGGNDEAKLKEMCKNFDLENNIIFTGKITDQNLLSKYYYFADLFCFPSTVDNCPIVKSEAASQKTPMLAIEGSASSENIEDNFNGFCCELDKNIFASKIIEITKNQQKLNEVSVNAYNTLNVGWDNVAEQIFEIYKELINKNFSNNKVNKEFEKTQ